MTAEYLSDTVGVAEGGFVGAGELVAVTVGVSVAVAVGAGVLVEVGVSVGVLVGNAVAVGASVSVGSGVGVGVGADPQAVMKTGTAIRILAIAEGELRKTRRTSNLLLSR